MTDTARASGEAMPKINRRKALALVGLSAVSTATIPTEGIAMTATPSDLATIEGLIAAHAEAMLLNDKLWGRVGDLDTVPCAKVEITRRYRGRDENGAEIFDPIYAYRAADIDERLQPHINAALSVWGRTDDDKRRIRDQFAACANEKKAELAAAEAECKRQQEASGYAAAAAAAERATETVKEIEAQILSFVPQSLAAAARLAQWGVEVYRSDEHCFYDPEEMAVSLLERLGKAGRS
jgi:hypothetical protein